MTVWPRRGPGTSAGSSSSTCCRCSGPGDIVLRDNARIHEAPDLVEQIEARGACVRPLPRYSPEFNPIERLWSKRPCCTAVEASDQEGLCGHGGSAAGGRGTCHRAGEPCVLSHPCWDSPPARGFCSESGSLSLST
ncbi:hypothetical protein AWN76_010465 [Rhodothermaceae bacterium RA]|nr:hypothetical protein AWN76_010465 [Rhodothermaceae bacterium RA]